MSEALTIRLRPGAPPLPEPPLRHPDLAAATAALPRGAYTTLRTVGRHAALMLDGHLARIAESATLLGQRWLFSTEEVRAGLCHLLDLLPWATTSESRFRLTLDDGPEGPILYLSAEPLREPSAERRLAGAVARTVRMTRANARAKDSRFYDLSADARRLLGRGVEEVLLMDDEGRMLEGLSSNLFLVREGRLVTPAEGILPGQTRALVLEAAAAAGMPIRLQAPTMADLAGEVELFITSTSRAVLPIVEVDGQPVGAGRPGAVTQMLAAAVGRQMRRRATPICGPKGPGGA